MVANVGMVNPYFQYNDSALLSDITGYNLEFPTNSSIFGGMPYAGGIPYTGGMNYASGMYGFPYMGMDIVANNRYYNQVGLEINSPEFAINGAMSVLNEKILTNEQEQIRGAIDNVVQQLRLKYPNADDAQLKRLINTEYQMRFGQPLTQAIRENGSTSFWQGFKQTATFGIANQLTAEDNIEYVTGQKQGRGPKAGKAIGRGLGAAAIGGLAAVIFNPFIGLAVAGVSLACSAIAKGRAKHPTKV